MNLNIDTDLKVITIDEDVSMKELMELVKRNNWEEYTIRKKPVWNTIDIPIHPIQVYPTCPTAPIVYY